MRYFMLDKYSTWYDWRLTLTAKDVSPAEPKTNYVALDGMHGTLDLTEALTGEVTYNDRTVSASFWTSEGTHEERVRLLRTITAALHGKKVPIVEPDDPGHFFLGRCVIKAPKLDQVHLEFTLEAVCEPWRYAAEETTRRSDVGGAVQAVDVVLHNDGDKTVVPVLNVTGAVSLTFNGETTKLQAGAYKVTDLRLRPGANIVRLTGSGTVTFTYREALL